MSKRTTYIESTNTPRIPEGVYDLQFIEHETGIRFGRKVFLWFEVISGDAHNGTKLARYYNVTKHIGRAGIKGGFSAGPKSKFVREHVTVFGEPKSIDEISVDSYYGMTVKGRVSTVTNDSTRTHIPEILQYSTISELISLQETTELVTNAESEESFKDSHSDDKEESFEVYYADPETGELISGSELINPGDNSLVQVPFNEDSNEDMFP